MYHCTNNLGKPSPFDNIGSSIIVGVCCIVAPMISLVHISTNMTENKKMEYTTFTIQVYVTMDNSPFHSTLHASAKCVAYKLLECDIVDLYQYDNEI